MECEQDEKVMVAFTCVLLAIRTVAIFYFIYQAKLYNSKKLEERDLYTSVTFLLLGISFSSLLVYKVIDEIDDIAYLFSGDKDHLCEIYNENKGLYDILTSILRICMGYLFQNLAFLWNLQRWLLIVSQESEREFREQVNQESLEIEEPTNKPQRRQYAFIFWNCFFIVCATVLTVC